MRRARRVAAKARTAYSRVGRALGPCTTPRLTPAAPAPPWQVLDATGPRFLVAVLESMGVPRNQPGHRFPLLHVVDGVCEPPPPPALPRHHCLWAGAGVLRP